MKWKREENSVTVYLSGEIDHCSARTIREEIDKLIVNAKMKRLIFDFSEVSFMDSSGIGMLIGRYKLMKEKNGFVYARGLTAEIKPIFLMAGLHRIMDSETEGWG